MKHSDTIPYYDELEPLAEALGDLYYDTLADFLHFLGDKLMQDANADMRRNRPALSGHLMACSLCLENASHEIQQAWEICKPHVLDKNKNQEKDNHKKMKPQKQSRVKRVTIASDTLAIVKQGYYQQGTEQISIKPLVDACNQQTRLYTPDELANLPAISNDYAESTIECINETTLQGAQRLDASGRFQRIGVLNFASAKNAGGGFLGGSQAQEETLARSSALYDSLQQCPTYYQYHRRQSKSLLYSDHMIYSPQCVVFKDDQGGVLAQPYTVDFITSPAPNRGALARNQPDALSQIDAVFTQRIVSLLHLAANQGCDALVLGAWGCGVFGNLPEKVARYFADALKEDGAFAHAFKHISFSIPENPKVLANTLAFREVLG